MDIAKDFRDRHIPSPGTVLVGLDGIWCGGRGNSDVRSAAVSAGAVIWLNPEPESCWGQGDSVIYRYQRFAHVAKSCNTLRQLERIMEDVLRLHGSLRADWRIRVLSDIAQR